eukprot:SAG25_NODE_913_length_4784_cov_7.021345_3_plen_319_part_00
MVNGHDQLGHDLDAGCAFASAPTSFLHCAVLGHAGARGCLSSTRHRLAIIRPACSLPLSRCACIRGCRVVTLEEADAGDLLQQLAQLSAGANGVEHAQSWHLSCACIAWTTRLLNLPRMWRVGAEDNGDLSRYRVLKRAQVRCGAEMTSTPVGNLEKGMTVVCLEIVHVAAKWGKSGQKGKGPLTRQRMRFKHPTVRDVSCLCVCQLARVRALCRRTSVPLSIARSGRFGAAGLSDPYRCQVCGWTSIISQSDGSELLQLVGTEQRSDLEAKSSQHTGRELRRNGAPAHVELCIEPYRQIAAQCGWVRIVMVGCLGCA